jgi:hypothetical protein
LACLQEQKAALGGGQVVGRLGERAANLTGNDLRFLVGNHFGLCLSDGNTLISAILTCKSTFYKGRISIRWVRGGKLAFCGREKAGRHHGRRPAIT